jgi:hypothetical protein
MPQADKSPIITSASQVGAGSRDRDQAVNFGGGRLIASAALIGAGVLVEPELLGGALLAAGVIYGLPFVGRILRPVVNTAVRLGYSAAVSISDVVAQAGQQVQSVAADARSQYRRPEDSSL